MNSKEPRILLIEPDEIARNEILNFLTGKNFDVVCSLKPDSILFDNRLETDPVGLILISDDYDRDVLSESSLVLGADKKLPQQIPTVVMTTIDSRKSPLELVVHNWFHTIKKPCDTDILYSVTCAATNQFNHVRSLLNEIETRSSAIGLITSGTFEFKTVDEARNLTTMLSLACPGADGIVIGLNELLHNAVEHGNLEIGYNLKTELLETSRLHDEIHNRLNMEPYNKRIVKVSYTRSDSEIVFVIEDEGKGFNWQKYLTIDDERIRSNHGRGIALAKMMAFTELNYNEKGNRVTAKIVL
ncbi:ATP-binding protein [Kiloniella spongiae]|uniref:ATP-binding protein n=1 Tax=Kiloniella spongiae TaxID=1489064 RepID=UPI000699A3BA|nr:ATP-binding protein [Kiloniella spongiae]